MGARFFVLNLIVLKENSLCLCSIITIQCSPLYLSFHPSANLYNIILNIILYEKNE